MRPQITELALPGLLLIRPARTGDARGYFSELFNRDELARYGASFAPIQENLAFSANSGVVRGLHAQATPSAQAKLVRAARGRIFDVAVDAREGSPTFGQWVAAELTAEGGEQLFVPKGFLHGYETREAACEVVYLVDGPYDPARELQVRWDDPDLGVEWNVPPDRAIISAKDRAATAWSAFRTPFRFGLI